MKFYQQLTQDFIKITAFLNLILKIRSLLKKLEINKNNIRNSNIDQKKLEKLKKLTNSQKVEKLFKS